MDLNFEVGSRIKLVVGQVSTEFGQGRTYLEPADFTGSSRETMFCFFFSLIIKPLFIWNQQISREVLVVVVVVVVVRATSCRACEFLRKQSHPSRAGILATHSREQLSRAK